MMNASATQQRRGNQPALEGAPLAGELLGWVAVVGLIVVAGLRCIVPFTDDLHWAADPRAGTGGLPEVGALGAVVLDWLGMLVLAVAVAANGLGGGRVRAGLVGLWAIGLGFALWHGWWSEAANADSLRIGSHWAGALALGMAAMHLADDPRRRRVMLAALVAMVIPIGAQAIYQVGVEHPATIANYEADPAAQLEARGWEEGSLEQRKFEQRLYQVQATARFSLGNVLGTVMATLGLAAAGILAALIADIWRRRGDDRDGAGAADDAPRPRPGLYGWTAAVGGVVVLAGAGLVLTFSRGAMLAAMMGSMAAAGACVLTWWRGWRPGRAGWVWAAVLIAVIVASLGAVVVRGMIGEPETMAGERSLLFRWHYMRAAVSMMAERPIVGVGPGGFAEQYLLHKNPLNPEDVSDPHSVFVFYLAALGIGGLAWAALLLGLVVAAGRSLGARAAGAGLGEPEPESEPQRKGRWAVVAVAGGILFGSQYIIELPRYWIDAALLWMVATAGWVAIAGWLSGRAGSRGWEGRLAAVGLLAAVGAMMAHAQIEMALTSIMAPPLLLALLGAAGGTEGGVVGGRTGGAGEAVERPGEGGSGQGGPSPELAPRGGEGARLASQVAVAGVVGLVLVMLALVVIPIGRQQSRLAEAATELAAGRPASSAQMLAAARGDWMPADPQVARQEAQLRAELAERGHRRGDTARRDSYWGAARRLLEEGRAVGERASLWRFEAILSQRAWRITDDRRWLHNAVLSAESLLEHEPYGLQAHVLAADLAREFGDAARARRWYSRALELHEQAYLDDQRQLPPDEHDRVRRALANLDGEA